MLPDTIILRSTPETDHPLSSGNTEKSFLQNSRPSEESIFRETREDRFLSHPQRFPINVVAHRAEAIVRIFFSLGGLILAVGAFLLAFGISRAVDLKGPPKMPDIHVPRLAPHESIAKLQQLKAELRMEDQERLRPILKELEQKIVTLSEQTLHVMEQHVEVERHNLELIEYDYLLFSGGSALGLGLFLTPLGFTLVTPAIKRRLKVFVLGVEVRWTDLKAKELELQQKECRLAEQRQGIHDERAKLQVTVRQEVEAGLRKVLSEVVEPQKQRLQLLEAALQLREDKLQVDLAHARSLLENAKNITEERKIAEALLAEADTASGKVAGERAELQRERAELEKRIAYLEALLQAAPPEAR